MTARINKPLLLLLAGCLAVGAGLNACSDDETAPDPFVFASDPPSAYNRVDRMGMPAIATAVISPINKDAYNEDDPTDDAGGTWASDITANIDSLHTVLDDDLAGAGLTPCQTGDCVGQAAPLVIPDVLRIDTGEPMGFPNGRLLTDPVIDVTLALVLLDLDTHATTTLADLPLNPAHNDKDFSGSVPFLAAPHTP